MSAQTADASFTGRTAWARNLATPVRDFLSAETGGAVVLLSAVAAALGGMAAAIAIFLAFNAGGSGAHAWGAAMSTDTALALGVLGLLAPQGTRLRLRLLTIAVVDDLVA